jgi:predicted MFS family arabinose efflux permease
MSLIILILHFDSSGEEFHGVTEVFGLDSLGVVLGLLSFMEAMAAMFGSYMGGYVFDRFGSYGPIFWAGASVAATGGLLSCFLRPRAPAS